MEKVTSLEFYKIYHKILEVFMCIVDMFLPVKIKIYKNAKVLATRSIFNLYVINTQRDSV